MNKINEDFSYIANSAKLTFSLEEEKKFTKDLNQLLKFIDEMNTQNTDNVEPMSFVNPATNQL